MTWPIQDLTIHRFRGIRELVLPGLGQVNLLVGGNNSGKTSVLEALALYCAPLDPWTWIDTAGRREPGSLRSSPLVQRLRWLFPQEIGIDRTSLYEGSIRLSGAGPFPVHSFTAEYRELLGTRWESMPSASDDDARSEELDVKVERRGAQIDVEIEVDQGDQLTFFERPPLQHSFTFWQDERFRSPRKSMGPMLPAETISPYDHWLRSLPALRFSEAKLGGGSEEPILALLKTIDPRISGAEVLLEPYGHQPTLFLRDDNAGLLPLSAFGDGFRRILLMALTLPRVAGGVLLIDEIETAIHVSALGKVFRWLLDACKQYDVQLFVTTHSLEALDAILAADTTPEEDVVGYRLEHTDSGHQVKRYGEDLLKRLRYERGLDVR